MPYKYVGKGSLNAICNNLDPPETPNLADDPFCATELEPVQCHMRLDICHDVAFLFLFTRQLATAPIFARTRRQFVSQPIPG